MFRGDVWDAHFPKPSGDRPCIILSSNRLITRLGQVVVAEITSTSGPYLTHLPVGADEGLTGRDQSWINVTSLHTIPKGNLQRQRGRLSPGGLATLSDALRLTLSLDDED